MTDRVGRGDRHGQGEALSAFPSKVGACSLRGHSGGKSVIDNTNVFSGVVLRRLDGTSIDPEPIYKLTLASSHLLGEILGSEPEQPEHSLGKQGHAVLRDRSHSKFGIIWSPDLSDDECVPRDFQTFCDDHRDRDPAPGQAQY